MSKKYDKQYLLMKYSPNSLPPVSHDFSCTCNTVISLTYNSYNPKCMDMNRYSIQCSKHGNRTGFKCLHCGDLSQKQIKTECGHLLCKTCLDADGSVICSDCGTYKKSYLEILNFFFLW